MDRPEGLVKIRWKNVDVEVSRGKVAIIFQWFSVNYINFSPISTICPQRYMGSYLRNKIFHI
jgi:hypothetical protein